MRALYRKARGAAAVEFGLVLPVLIAILLGVIDYGHYFFTEEIMLNAAREGARAGTVTSGDPAAVAQSVATAYMDNMGLTAAGRSISAVSLAGPPASIQVTINYPPGSLTGFTQPPLFPSTRQAIAEMRR